MVVCSQIREERGEMVQGQTHAYVHFASGGTYGEGTMGERDWQPVSTNFSHGF